MITSSQTSSVSLGMRRCGDCALCCKVMRIDELDKPHGVWCAHCRRQNGCAIYDSKPAECGTFNCLYLVDPNLGEEWKPSRSKIVMVLELGGSRLAAYVDPQRPDAWRKEPFYSALKTWANAASPPMSQVVVFIGQRTIVIFPDRDVDIGLVGPDDRIVARPENVDGVVRLHAYKVHRDDPRFAIGAAQPVLARVPGW